MNFKDMIFTITLALATTWGIQYLVGRYTGPTSEGSQTGQSFVVPEGPQSYKPLNKEVDFIDSKRPRAEQETIVDTPLVAYVFSSDAASIERIEMKKGQSGLQEDITTVFPVSDTQREDRCLLVALNQETPYYYTLLSRKDNPGVTELVYEAPFKQGTIEKKYTIVHQSYAVDLELTIKTDGSAVEPRIFFPSPIVPEIASSDAMSGITTDAKGNFKITARAKLNPQEGWFAPSIFGTQDKYFVHVLALDPNHFTQRAYYRFSDKIKLYSVLEGPEITQTQTWKLTFYFGPKESGALIAVNPQLDQLMGYSGWLAPVSKLLLAILRFLYSYLHNYGLAIIALTLLVRLIMLPFTARQGGMKRNRNDFQRKLRLLEKKYKDNPEALARERAALMQQEVLPGIAGCLPLFLQFPIFIALNRVLSSAIELYQAPFYGWIHDLSAPDPYYVLPFAVFISMVVHALYTDAQQRPMMIAVAFFIGGISTYLSVGLLLYILMGTILGILQSRLFERTGA